MGGQPARNQGGHGRSLVSASSFSSVGDWSGAESRLSRRALFGAGLGRFVRHRLEGLKRLGGELPFEERPERRPTVARSWLKEEIRREWSDGDPRPLLGRLEAAAEVLAQAAGSGAGQRVLDVGAGDGNLALALARRGAAVVAADLSPAMVERGRTRTRRRGTRSSGKRPMSRPYLSPTTGSTPCSRRSARSGPRGQAEWSPS